MSDPKPSGVVFVADVSACSAFYRDVAAMTELHRDDDHVVLESRGFQLTVHRLAGEPSVQRDADGRMPIRYDTYVKLCFPVESIAAARTAAKEKGGAIKPPEAEWEARGFRACDGHDPEGNVIQVRERA